MSEWIKTNSKGIRYKEHKSRKHGMKFDRYFEARFQVDGKMKSRGLGWASEGWTLEKAVAERLRLTELAKREGVMLTQKEEREIQNQAREADEKARIEKEQENISIDSVWEKYLSYSMTNKTKSSWQTESGYYKNWIQPVIGLKPMKDVRPLDLERIKKNMLQADKAQRTVQYVLAVIRQIYNYATDHHLYNGDNPSTKVKRPKFDNRRSEFFSEEQAVALLKNLSLRSSDLHDMALLSLRCGLRAGEIFGLVWQDISLERETITIRDPKNNRNRTVPMMTPDVTELFSRRKETSSNNLIFPDKNGGKRKEVSNLFERVIKELGYNDGVGDRRHKLTFHSLRHTCASWLVMKGVPLYTVKEILGHRSITMTERYSHLTPDAFEGAKKAMSVINL